VRGILDILGGADALSPPVGAPWQIVNPGFADVRGAADQH
jgi:hypothetical protein